MITGTNIETELTWIDVKDTLKALNNFKNKYPKCTRWCFLKWKSIYILSKSIYIYIKFIQYTIHWDKKNSFWTNKRCNKILLSRAPTHHSFAFNFRFLDELKNKVRLSKTVCGIFHFRFRFVFIKVYIFLQQNVWTLWL